MALAPAVPMDYSVQMPVAPETFAERPVDISGLPSLRARNFPYSGPYPWLDQPDALDRIDAKLKAGELTEYQATQCRYWVENGYIILPGLIDHETLDRVWEAYEQAAAAGVITLPPEPISDDDSYPGRSLDPHLKIDAFCQILRHEEMLAWTRLLMDREPKPFQTIAGHKGSQQGAHSDSIHMTTYPLGYLTAGWVAFEDIHPDCGPLVYYPGSHRLPYLFSDDVGITEADFRARGYAGYHERYEPRIRELVKENKIEPHYFNAKKGDVLLWHANLIHGGSPRKNVQLSRRAVVCHYFVEGTFAYHDLSAMESRPFAGTCLLREQPVPEQAVPVLPSGNRFSRWLQSLMSH
jgi:Phytanoyl-CoA dioxygenase (PhyH)